MNNTTQDCGRHFLTECDCQPQTSEGSWEKEFEKFFGSLENEMGGITNRVPVNTSLGVADLGTMIFLDIQKQVKAFIRNLLARERRKLSAMFPHPEFCEKSGKQFKKCVSCVLDDLTREESKNDE